MTIKGVRESTLPVGKSHARNPTQNPTPNRPKPSQTKPNHIKHKDPAAPSTPYPLSAGPT